MRTSKALLGVLAGTAAGAIIGLKLAPQKGSRTRRRILRKSEDLGALLNDKIDGKFEELIDSLADEKKKSKTRDAAGSSSQSKTTG